MTKKFIFAILLVICTTTTNLYSMVCQSDTVQLRQTKGGGGSTHYYWRVRYNWGWADSSNGWYNGGVFQPTNYSHNYSNSIRLIKVQP